MSVSLDKFFTLSASCDMTASCSLTWSSQHTLPLKEDKDVRAFTEWQMAIALALRKHIARVGGQVSLGYIARFCVQK